MPGRPRKLGVDEKEKNTLAIGQDDFRRHWVSAEPGTSRNIDVNVAFNKQDNGFEHLKLPVSSLVGDKVIDPPDFSNFGPEEDAKYYDMIRSKLTLAKDYITKEQELSLDPDRLGLRHELTSKALAAPPIMIDLESQQMMRLLVDTGAELRRLIREATDDELEAALEVPMSDYLCFWERLQLSIARQLPGEDDEAKMDKTDKILDEVLEKAVDP